MNKNKNVASFSLFGDNPKYCEGIIRNADLVKSNWIGWDMIVYIKDVPENVIERLKQYEFVTIIDMSSDVNSRGMFWRFYTINNSNYDRMISRDADSSMHERDLMSVNEWIESDKDFHIIRDHPQGHGSPIGGGMWGAKINCFPDMREKVNNYISTPDLIYNKDQTFLKQIVYPEVVNRSLVHDEYFKYEAHAKPISFDRSNNNFEFIGESLLGDGSPNGEQREACKRVYYSRMGI